MSSSKSDTTHETSRSETTDPFPDAATARGMFELFPEMFDGTFPREYFFVGPSDSHGDAESNGWIVGQPVVSETQQSQETMMPIRDATTMQGTATSQAKHRNPHLDTASENGSRASLQTKPGTFPDSDFQTANKFIKARAGHPGDSQTITLSASVWMCSLPLWYVYIPCRKTTLSDLECSKTPGPKTYHNQLRHVRAHLYKSGKSVTEQNAADSGVRVITCEDVPFFDEDQRESLKSTLEKGGEVRCVAKMWICVHCQMGTYVPAKKSNARKHASTCEKRQQQRNKKISGFRGVTMGNDAVSAAHSAETHS